MRHIWRNDQGIAAVELVIVAPVLIAFLGGVLIVGSFIQAVAVVRNAAREGAHYAAVGDTNASANAVSYLNSALFGRTDAQLASATAVLSYPVPPGSSCPGGSSPKVGCPVAMTVTLPINVPVFGGTTNVTSSATMEQMLVTS